MKIKLITDRHEHAGELVPPGTVLDIPDNLADYMIANGLAEPVLSAKTNKTKGVSNGAVRKSV